MIRKRGIRHATTILLNRTIRFLQLNKDKKYCIAEIANGLHYHDKTYLKDAVKFLTNHKLIIQHKPSSWKEHGTTKYSGVKE